MSWYYSSSASGIQDLWTGGRWFNPWLGQYSFWGLMRVIAAGFIPLSPLPLFHWWLSSYVGKRPVAWKEYCAEFWLKECRESIDRCSGHSNITEILLKTELSIIQSIIHYNLSNFSSLPQNPRFHWPWERRLQKHFQNRRKDLTLNFLTFPHEFSKNWINFWEGYNGKHFFPTMFSKAF